MNWNGTMRHVLIALILLLGSLPAEAAKRRALSPHKASCKSPDSGVPCTLAFVSERDGNSEIYLINVDGTGLLRLTDDAGADVDPAWSPDGKRIAFSSDRSGGLEIYIMDADGSNPVRRTYGGWSQTPAWSADGKKIAFASVRNGERRVYVMGVDGDGTNPTLVGYDRGWNADPAWSADGERIAFSSDWWAFDFVYDVHVMNADGSQISTLIEGPFFGPPTYYFQPSWSPDGGRIAVVVCAYGWDNCYPDSSIAIANADGSGLKTLVQTGGYAGPAWSPDGKTIAFSSQTCRSCVGELRYVSADGNKSGVIFWNGHDPAWRP
jgi:Tol biopolymer transport system component